MISLDETQELHVVDARLTDTEGNGVGRWRKYYEATDLEDALWASRNLVPKAQVRIRVGHNTVVAGPCLAEELRTLTRNLP